MSMNLHLHNKHAVSCQIKEAVFVGQEAHGCGPIADVLGQLT